LTASSGCWDSLLMRRKQQKWDYKV
jgi:hypothetical protein